MFKQIEDQNATHLWYVSPSFNNCTDVCLDGAGVVCNIGGLKQ